jgi:hypothetical protein
MPVYLFEMENQAIRSPHYACQHILSNSKYFVKQLISRKSYKDLERETHTHNMLNSYVTPVQMIGMGIGGIIGQ